MCIPPCDTQKKELVALEFVLARSIARKVAFASVSLGGDSNEILATNLSGVLSRITYIIRPFESTNWNAGDS